MESYQTIGNICNYYGGLIVKTENDKYYWAIDEDAYPIKWEEIPKHLYEALLDFDTKNQK